MPVQEEERKKEEQVYEEPEENKRKQAPEQQEKKDEISNNTEEIKSGKLLSFLNVKAELTEAYNTSLSMTEKIDIQNKLNGVDRRIMKLNEKLDSIEEPKKLPDKAVDETMKAAEEKVTEIENSETEISVSEISDELTETVHEKIHSLDIEGMSAEENIDNSEISYGRKDSVLFVADIDPATCSDD